MSAKNLKIFYVYIFFDILGAIVGPFFPKNLSKV